MRLHVLSMGFRSRASYGVDAPPVLWSVAAGAAALLALTILLAALDLYWWATLTAVAAAIAFIWLGLYLHTTRRGKFGTWEDIISGFDLCGDERILDAGCGRGMVMLLAARRMVSGRAVGVDLWRSVDQSGNDIEATRKNAEVEGLSGRVELRTGDVRSLPFESGEFDLVLSNLVVHNMHDVEDRRRAIEDMIRVLVPGGRLAIVDIFGRAREYEGWIDQWGGSGIERRRLGMRFWYGPFMAAELVTARRPRDTGDDTQRSGAC